MSTGRSLSAPLDVPAGAAPTGHGQIVLVLQGGGALGAYQAGVYEALREAGMEPDWVIGTSIGAINAAIIAGNHPPDRLAALHEFWHRVTHDPIREAIAGIPVWGAMAANLMTVAAGVGGFFAPNPAAALGLPTTPETTALYGTADLERTLRAVIDPAVLEAGDTRLTVGAANVRTGDMHYFDSRRGPLSVRHVLASGALPPAFPAIRIGSELFWDGGILSNTPIEAVFDDEPRRSGLVFAVHIWHPSGPEPDTLARVLSRTKDLQYASRSTAQVARQKQLHRLRHVVAELAAMLPAEVRNTPEAKALKAYGCLTRMHVMRLQSPAMAGEDHTKDIDFSASGIAARWAAGLADTRRVLLDRPWTRDFDPMEGVILHEAEAGTMVREG